MANLEERLALHAYMLEAANALGDAERKLLTALGQATTLSAAPEAEEAADLVREQVEAVRSAAQALSDWLDGGKAVA